ncbi:hypothetical protein TUM20985_23940 [Mycobacterium antarcticum]|nr:hypothetical protein TUM20985_23940 [Mycolicibacterium sp. TUM20985]
MAVETDRIADPWGARTPYGRDEQWPRRVDTQLADGITDDQVRRWVQTAAVLHSNGDGLDIAERDARIVGVRGRAVDRVNPGQLDVKDLFGWRANSSPDRLSAPLIRRNGQLVDTDWDTALDRIVSRTSASDLTAAGASPKLGDVRPARGSVSRVARPRHRRSRS